MKPRVRRRAPGDGRATKRPPTLPESPPPAASAAGDRAAGALWIALIALAALRLVLAFVPNMWAWGLNLQRFLDPLPAWSPWLITALALIPAFARRLERPCAWLGDRLARGAFASFLLAALVALIVWGSADRTRFIGDFLLRQGTIEEGGDPARLFPQSLPLDVALHYHLPTALKAAGIASANTTGRLIGALDAALLALLAATFVRTLALRGVAALTAWAVVTFGGYLCLFTGYNKGLADLVVLTAAVGVFGVRLARERRGALALGVSLAVALALHRSALALLPAAALAFAIGLRGSSGAWRRSATLIALVLPLAALAMTLPQVLRTLFGYDIVHLAPAEARSGGFLGGAFAPGRLADVLSLVAAFSPLALLLPFLAWAPGRAWVRRSETAVLLALAAPLVIALFVIHPVQGMFRDWDVFATAGVALSLIAAELIGGTLNAAPAWRWVGVALLAGVMMPTLQWLVHFTDVNSGLRRIEAFATESPRRSENERLLTWDFVGIRSYRLRRWDDAVRAWQRAADIAPAPRILEEWVRGELVRGNLRGAQTVLHRLLDRAPEDVMAWRDLADVAARIPDPADELRARECLRALGAGDIPMPRIGAYMATPDSVRR